MEIKAGDRRSGGRAAEPGAADLANSIPALLAVLDRAYDRPSWHGANLRGALRGVPVDQASRRPRPSRHNVWELVVHAAYWKYAVRRRLRCEPRGSFPLAGSNWFIRPDGEHSTAAAWRRDLLLLDEMHQALRQSVAALTCADLSESRGGRGKVTVFDIVAGIAAHDVYHAGQIQLLKRLVR